MALATWQSTRPPLHTPLYKIYAISAVYHQSFSIILVCFRFSIPTPCYLSLSLHFYSFLYIHVHTSHCDVAQKLVFYHIYHFVSYLLTTTAWNRFKCCFKVLEKEHEKLESYDLFCPWLQKGLSLSIWVVNTTFLSFIFYIVFVNSLTVAAIVSLYVKYSCNDICDRFSLETQLGFLQCSICGNFCI